MKESRDITGSFVRLPTANDKRLQPMDDEGSCNGGGHVRRGSQAISAVCGCGRTPLWTTVLVILGLLISQVEYALGNLPREGYISAPQYVYAGDTVVVVCTLPVDVGMVTQPCKWATPYNSLRSQAERTHHRTNRHRCFLEIVGANLTDSGPFSCMVTYTDRGGEINSVRLTASVVVLPRPASYQTRIGHTYLANVPPNAVRGSTTSVACGLRTVGHVTSATTDPRPAEYDWSCTGIAVQSSPRVQVNRHTGQLTIHNITSDDAGTCTCRAGCNSGAASFNLTVVKRPNAPTQVRFIPDSLRFELDYPYQAGPLPSQCAVSLKHGENTLARVINCRKLTDNDYNRSVYFLLDEDFFVANEIRDLKNMLGDQIRLRIAFMGRRKGRHATTAQYLPVGPNLGVASLRITNCSGSHGHHVTATLAAPRTRRRLGQRYLPVQWYQVFMCQELPNHARCWPDDKSVWVNMTGAVRMGSAALITNLEFKRCIADMRAGRAYTIMFVIGSGTVRLDFSVWSPVIPLRRAPPPGPYHVDTRAPTIAGTKAPITPPNSEYRRQNVHVGVRLTRDSLCQRLPDEIENATLQQTIHQYFTNLCSCSLKVPESPTKTSNFRRSPKAGCNTMTDRIGRETIKEDFSLAVDRCNLLKTIQSDMMARGKAGAMQLAGDKYGQTRFAQIEVEVTYFNWTTCPGILGMNYYYPESGEKFRRFTPEDFPDTTASPPEIKTPWQSIADTPLGTASAATSVGRRTVQTVVATGEGLSEDVKSAVVTSSSLTVIVVVSVLGATAIVAIVGWAVRRRRGPVASNGNASDLNNNSSTGGDARTHPTFLAAQAPYIANVLQPVDSGRSLNAVTQLATEITSHGRQDRVPPLHQDQHTGPGETPSVGHPPHGIRSWPNLTTCSDDTDINPDPPRRQLSINSQSSVSCPSLHSITVVCPDTT